MKTISVTILIVLIAGVVSTYSVAQSVENDILVTIAGDKVTQGEFLNVYTKNNLNNEVIDKKSLDDYLELYINFKLKVKEAEELGMDTVSSFINELDGYRTQLAQPYLTDESVIENLIKEAYDRMFFDIRASHILIRIPPDALPADTLAAYKKIVNIREQIARGKDFGEMAVAFSEDPSATDRPAAPNRPPMKGNHGDLGYFTVFDMVYPFENGAYNTPVGEVSQPVRSDFGYHLIKVTDKKNAMGKIQVAHILITFPPSPTSLDSLRLKDKAFAAYNEIISGKDFSEVVKSYSDDKGTVEKGGILPWFGVNRMIPEFISEVSLLENIGDVSRPFLTVYGWHIVKLIDKKEIGTFDEKYSEIKQKISRNDRAKTSRNSFIHKMKEDYHFQEYPENLSEFYQVVNDSLLKGKWNPELARGMSKALFVIDEHPFTQEDFATYLAKNQKGISPDQSVKATVHAIYQKYTEDKIIAYEDSKLEEKYPDFKMLMKEYRDGILLFELTDKKIWSQAIQDTLGLEKFFESNRQNYMWDERVDATVYTVTRPEDVKTIRKLVRKNTPKNDILNMINQDSLMVLTIINDKYQRGDNEVVDAVEWKVGMSDNFVTEGASNFVVMHQLLPPEPKLLSEARGIITADYQNFLEQQWITQLRSKYPVEINHTVLDSIK